MPHAADNLTLTAPPTLWRRHAPPCALATAMALAVGGGTLWAARSAGIPPAPSAMLTLMAVTIWIGLATAPLSAGAEDAIGALCRGGIGADASLLTLLAAGFWGGGVVDFWTAAKVYLLWAGLALALSMLTRLARTPPGRAGLAVAGSAVAAGLMGSLFWSPGLLAALSEPARSWALKLVLYPNPLAGLTALAGPKAGFVWTQTRVLYGITRIGQDYPAPLLSWWTPFLLWSGAGLALLAGLGLRRAVRSFLYGA